MLWTSRTMESSLADVLQEEETTAISIAKGDVEPCVFIHYSGANIREKSLLRVSETAVIHGIQR